MLNSTKSLFILGAFFLALVAHGSVEAAEVAETRTASSISWAPPFEYHHVVISLSGPAGVTSWTVSKDDPLMIDTAGLEGWAKANAFSADGLYTYEVRFSVPIVSQQRQPNTATTKGTGRDDLATRPSFKATVISGYFRVKDGSMVVPDADGAEQSVAKDIVHADDVIVQFSQCIGNDCVNGESFGFDTLRLKENNLRIHFDDTSASASFPANDWRIIVNETENGGQDLFAIEDSTAGRNLFVLEAGAPANSLYLDDNGRLGLGTSTPAVEIQVTDGDTPTLRLDQDNSNGWGAYVWDVAANETNFFIRDVTAGSNLAFRIQPGTPGDALTLRSSGYVGMGTWSPSAPLEIETNGEPSAILLNNNGNGTWYLTSADDGTFSLSATGVDGEELLILDSLGNLTTSGTVNGISDRDSKLDFMPVNTSRILHAIAKMSITSWSLIGDTPGVRHLGPTAQDFYAAFGLGADERHIAMSDVGGVALAAIQALTTELEERDRQIDRLEKRLEALERSMR